MERDRVFPPNPLSLLSWPLFLQTHDTGYEFAVRLDSRDVMVSGTLQISEESTTRILLLFGPSDTTVHLGETEIGLLRELERKGIDVKIALNPVRCFGGIIGWSTVPLEEYLEKSRPSK